MKIIECRTAMVARRLLICGAILREQEVAKISPQDNMSSPVY